MKNVKENQVILVTEDAEGHKRSIETTVQELYNDWMGKCNLVPENDATVYFASVDDTIIQMITAEASFDNFMEKIIKPMVSKPSDLHEIIRKRAEKDKLKKQDDKHLKDEKQISLVNSILAYKDRIKELISYANECMDNDVEIPRNNGRSHEYNSAAQYGYDAEFIAEGICHNLGLMQTWPRYSTTEKQKREFKYIGIRNGGCCGTVDFYTDGDRVFGKRNTGDYSEVPARIQDMEQFLRQFDKLESAFRNWIESLLD